MGLSTTSSSKKVEKERVLNISNSLPAPLPMNKYDNDPVSDAVSGMSPTLNGGSLELNFNDINECDISNNENKEVRKEEEVEDLEEEKKVEEEGKEEVEEVKIEVEEEVEEEVEAEEEDLSDKAVEARHEGVLKGMRDKWAFLQKMRMERKYALLGLPFIWDEGTDLGSHSLFLFVFCLLLLIIFVFMFGFFISIF